MGFEGRRLVPFVGARLDTPNLLFSKIIPKRHNNNNNNVREIIVVTWSAATNYSTGGFGNLRS